MAQSQLGGCPVGERDQHARTRAINSSGPEGVCCCAHKAKTIFFSLKKKRNPCRGTSRVSLRGWHTATHTHRQFCAGHKHQTLAMDGDRFF